MNRVNRIFNEIVERERKNGVIIEHMGYQYFKLMLGEDLGGRANAMCFRMTRTIYLKDTEFEEIGEYQLFTLFHELGHIYNNSDNMIDCECEYFATIFAMAYFNKYKLILPEERRKAYQDYIYERRAVDKEKGLKVPSKKSLKLMW